MNPVLRFRSMASLVGPALVLLSPLAAMAAPLRVGLSGSPPFVMSPNERPGGISVQVWEQVAAERDYDYRFVVQPNATANLNALAAGQLDVAIGPITISPKRVSQPGFDFTQPYFYAEEGLLVPKVPPGLMTRLRPFFGVAALSSFAILLLSIFVVGNLIWLAERRSNHSQFPRNYLHGLGNAMWFALVTLTTVGYGDRAPQSRTGRAITAIWMVLSLVAVSSITAGLASAFTLALSRQTLAPIVDAAQLQGAQMAVVRGTTSVSWGEVYGARLKQAGSLQAAIKLLQDGTVEGVIFDRPALRYWLMQNPESGLQLAPFDLAKQTYGFAVRSGSPLRKPINVILLQMHRSGAITRIVDSVLSDNPQRSVLPMD